MKLKLLIVVAMLFVIAGCVAVKCSATITDPNSGRITKINLDYQRNFADLNAADVNIIFDLKEEKAIVRFKSEQSPQDPLTSAISTVGIVLVALWKVIF